MLGIIADGLRLGAFGRQLPHFADGILEEVNLVTAIASERGWEQERCHSSCQNGTTDMIPGNARNTEEF